MVRTAKELIRKEEILSSPKIKIGKRLPDEAVKMVRNFFENDEVSGKAMSNQDFVSGMESGSRTINRKDYI